MRVYELARELNVKPKDMASMLSNASKTYTTASGVSDDDIARAKKAYASGSGNSGSKDQENQQKSDSKKDSMPKNSEEKSHDAKSDYSKSKQSDKIVSELYFPQNSSRPAYKERTNISSKTNYGQKNIINNNATYRNSEKINEILKKYDEKASSSNNNIAPQASESSQNNDRAGRNDRSSNTYNNRDRSDNRSFRNDRNSSYGNRDRNNDRSSDRNNDRSGNRSEGSFNRDRNSSYGNRDRNDNRNFDRNNNRSEGSFNRSDRGGSFNRSEGYNSNRENGYNNRTDGSSNRNSYGNRDRIDRGQQGSYNNSNGGNKSGFNRNGQQGANRGQGNFNRSKGGHADSGVSDSSFMFDAKNTARRQEHRNDNHKNDYDKKNVDAKENLRFSKNGKKPNTKPNKPEKKEETIKQITLPDTLTIKELAERMKVVPAQLIKKLFLSGEIVTINTEVEYDKAEEIALEFNCICEHEKKVDVIAELLKEDDEDEAKLVSRPPVVCVMGHVDHGKTSLLDAIRETHVTAKESGGITQKIGAYTVDVNGQSITFLDTPGHEAFTAMRMRGAQATDIAILVVAADDGVMPQTIEAINHAKAADVEIIVAVNKIDKPNANLEKVKQELMEYELVPEDWGGSTIFCPVSAHTKEGIDNLLDMILLTAEVQELKADPSRNARGIVIEAELDKGRGSVATVLVQKGTLHVGDYVAAGECYGKIRAMINDKNKRVKVAGPSTPVEILGLNAVPNAGEILVAKDTEKESRAFAETFIAEGKKKLLDDTKHKVSLDAIFDQIKAGNMKELAIIIKADVQGSVEAVKASLVKLSNEEVAVKVIHGGVGNINESDVVLASASNAIIIGFNVKPDNQAREVADRENVDLRLYSVIYNAIEDVSAALKGMLEPIYTEQIIGHATIRQMFKASGIGNIAGCTVDDGRITRDSKVRITRGKDQIFEGPIATLKHFKDDVKEVKGGAECGIVVEGFNEIQVDDVLEAYIMVEVPR